MNIKNRLAVLGLSAAIIVGGAASVSAAAGWQLVGKDYHIEGQNNPYDRMQGRTHVSRDGGNMALVVPDHEALGIAPGDEPSLWIQVFESDGALGSTRIAQLYVNVWEPMPTGYKHLEFSVGQYADGLDGKAEIFATYGANYDSHDFTVQIYD